MPHPSCAPCKQTFCRVSDLLDRLDNTPELPVDIRVEASAVRASLTNTGYYLIDRSIAENTQRGF